MPSRKRADPSETSSEGNQEEKKDKKKKAAAAAVDKEANEAAKKLNDTDAEFTIQLDDDEDEAAAAADEEKVEEAKDGADKKSTKTEKSDDAKPSHSPPSPEEKEEEKVEDEAETDGTEDAKKVEEEPERTEVREEEKEEKKEETVEAAEAPASRESSKTPVPEEPATGEVVEEVPLSVKEQIAAFSQLRLQETHGKPKPGVATAFAPKPAAPPPPLSAQKAAPSPPVEEARPVAQKAAPPQPAVRSQSNQLFENPQPKPFYAAVEKPVELPVEKAVEKPAVPAEVARVEPVAWNAMMTTKVTDFGMEDSPFPGFQQQHQPPWFNGERKPSYEQPRPRPQPQQQQQLRQQKLQQHTSSTKWTPTVAKTEAPAPPASKLAAFGTVYKEPQLTQASEQRQQASPKKHIGPEIVSSSTGPSQLVRLRRQNSEINWGFAVFGGADFGCPPFISRVSLLSIAGKAGLEVGDIIVSICNTPVQGKQHTDIKSEILRAGNELDFMIIKQGIDKRVLSEKVPEVLQPAASMEPQPWQSVQRETRVSTDVYRTTTNRQQQQQYPSSRASSTGSSPYRPIRTNSLRLLDEYIANRSMQPKNEPTIRVYTTPTYQMEPSSRTDFTSDYYTTSTVVRSNRNVSSSLSPSLQTVTFTPQPAYQQQQQLQQQPLSYGRPGALSPRPYFASSAHSTNTVKYVSAEPSPRGRTVYTGIPYDSLTSQVFYNNNNTVRTQPLRVTTMSNSYQQQPQRQQQYTYKQTSGQVYSRPTYYSSYDPEPERWSTTGTTTETTTTNSAWL